MNRVRFPDVGRVGLGVGLDMHLGAPIGFDTNGKPQPRVHRFLNRHAADFATAFFSWQPRGRGRLDLQDYEASFNALLKGAPDYQALGLHHTRLNLAAPPDNDQDELLAFTNALIRRFGFDWVNEDLGLWSVDGKPMPYPLPPYLTEAGLDQCVANCRFWQTHLEAPLLVEFPGFSDGISLSVGHIDAYDFFREVVIESGSPCTLDLGHLISWRWRLGHRGEGLFADLDRLPLNHCFEVHMSGCLVSGERWVDAHHGVLRHEQLTLLERLLPRLPNLRVVTYEDPKFDEQGALPDKALPGFEALKGIVANRQSRDLAPPAVPPEPITHTDIRPLHDAFARLLFDERARTHFIEHGQLAHTSAADLSELATIHTEELSRAANLIASHLMDRRYAGLGRINEVFTGIDVSDLWPRFLASKHAASWREVGHGRCVEEAFFRFCFEQGVGHAADLRRQMLTAVLTTLSRGRRPAFSLPEELTATPRGYASVINGCLVALVDNQLVTGPVSALIADLIYGHDPVSCATRHRVSTASVELLSRALTAKGLLSTTTPSSSPRALEPRGYTHRPPRRPTPGCPPRRARRRSPARR